MQADDTVQHQHHTQPQDSTPFGLAPLRNRAQRKRMRRWVYGAGVERLGHLALIPRSRASARFARRHLLLIAIALTTYQLSDLAWHRVVRTKDNIELRKLDPQGHGWIRIARRADASPVTLGMIALWWNPKCAGIAAAIGLAAAVLFAYAIMLVLLSGRRLLSAEHRDQGRLRGALDYSTAWLVLIALGGFLTLLRPMRDVADLYGWPVPSAEVVYIVAATCAGAGLLMWWFWLVRLAGRLAGDEHRRCIAFYGLIAPVLITGLTVAWLIGCTRLIDFLCGLFKLGWEVST